MQQLHLVGFTTDLDGLIFSARRGAKSGGYLVALDDRFVALIKEAVRLQTGVDLDEEIEEENASQTGGRRRGRAARYLIQVDSALTPKEIQARLRAGRTVEEIALPRTSVLRGAGLTRNFCTIPRSRSQISEIP